MSSCVLTSVTWFKIGQYQYCVHSVAVEIPQDLCSHWLPFFQIESVIELVKMLPCVKILKPSDAMFLALYGA